MRSLFLLSTSSLRRPVAARLATTTSAAVSPTGVIPYFGTMTFGWSQASSQVDADVASEMVEMYGAAGGTRLDTARVYAGGQTETILGKVLAGSDRAFAVGTKAHPSEPGGLSAKGIRDQLTRSLEALGVDRVEEFYLHQPDPLNDLAESLACCEELVAEGLIGKVGMSNYHVDEVRRAFELCDANGWHGAKPVVYQGLYNPLNRGVEDGLLELLRSHGATFVAYNPLAAGLLTGKHEPSKVPEGRFKENPNYLPRFFTEANFAALEPIRAACSNAQIDMVEATYRWLRFGSALEDGDALLIGASSLDHSRANILHASSPNKLPGEVQAAFDAAYATVTKKEPAFAYWRSYSADHPNRENLDQGASYSAKKAK